jgi:hypothetical protein
MWLHVFVTCLRFVSHFIRDICLAFCFLFCSGNGLLDPCAKGVYTTEAYPSSCDHGVASETGGFEAPQVSSKTYEL